MKIYERYNKIEGKNQSPEIQAVGMLIVCIEQDIKDMHYIKINIDLDVDKYKQRYQRYLDYLKEDKG